VLEALQLGLTFRWDVKESEFMRAKDLSVEFLDFGCHGGAVTPMAGHTGWERDGKELGANVFDHRNHLLIAEVLGKPPNALRQPPPGEEA
jgi:hypothetical protein